METECFEIYDKYKVLSISSLDLIIKIVTIFGNVKPLKGL